MAAMIGYRARWRPAIAAGLAILLACSRRNDSAHPSHVVGEWVYDTTISFAIGPADTTPSFTDDSATQYEKEFERSVYREDPLRSGDRSMITDTLVLRRSGAGFRRTVATVKNPRRADRRSDSTIRFSSWNVTVDPRTNRATLCTSEEGYGPRACYGLRVIGGALVFNSINQAGLPPSGGFETKYRQLK